MYIATLIHPGFAYLVRYAPVAVNSGLRPETHRAAGGLAMTIYLAAQAMCAGGAYRPMAALFR